MVLLYKIINKQRNPERKGFTILELLVVILIMTILGGMAIWAYRKSLGNETLKNAAIELTQTLENERYKAIERGEQRGVLFVTPSIFTTFKVDSTLAQVPEISSKLPRGLRYGNGGVGVALPVVNIAPAANGIMFSGNACVFNQYGMAVNPGAIVVTGRVGTAGIIVSPAGQIKAYRWEAGIWTELK